ncbi:hypothetical protein WA158_006307 [Blastocystis sp. Blastoise]
MSSESESESNTTLSDETISEAIKELLEAAHYENLTPRIIRTDLEKKYHCSLIEKKQFIKTQITQFLKEYKQKLAAQTTKAKKEPKEKKSKKEKKAAKTEEDDEEEEEKTKEKTRSLTVCKISDKLAAVLGETELPRPSVVSALWKYIHGHDLQDKENKRQINFDDTLKSVFNCDNATIFSINQLLNDHLTPTDKKVEVVNKTKKAPKEKKTKKTKAVEYDENGEKIVRPNGLTRPLPLSPELAEFVGESEMSRPQVVKHIWQYIKENKLQDPSDGRKINCDDKLTALLGERNVSAFKMNTFLSRHFIKNQN